MDALRLVSIYIFNGMSRMAHRRRTNVGHPFQIPYPSTRLRSATGTRPLIEVVAAKRIPNKRALDDRVSTAQNVDAGHARTASIKSARRTISDEHGEPPVDQPSRDAASSSAKHKRVFESAGAASELLANDRKMKQFMLQLEDELLKLLEPSEEGVKVPRPVPFPTYFERAPEIPISHTYTSILRRLHTEKKMSVDDEHLRRTVVGTKYPKKPAVPPYHQPDIVEQREKTIKLIMKHQEEMDDSGRKKFAKKVTVVGDNSVLVVCKPSAADCDKSKKISVSKTKRAFRSSVGRFKRRKRSNKNLKT